MTKKNIIDLLKNKEAIDAFSYPNGDYAYKTKDWFYHLLRTE